MLVTTYFQSLISKDVLVISIDLVTHLWLEAEVRIVKIFGIFHLKGVV